MSPSKSLTYQVPARGLLTIMKRMMLCVAAMGITLTGCGTNSTPTAGRTHHGFAYYQRQAGISPLKVQHHHAPPPSGASTKPASGPRRATHIKAKATVRPHYTVAEENALRTARQYLSVQGYSRAGLITQLSSKYGSGYKLADATWAVGHLRVNWRVQAVRSAREYLQIQGYSRAGLITQLSSPYGSHYTVAQAVFAANHVGL